jgi:phosphate transport system permease protein
MNNAAVGEIRELIARHKRWDLIFASIGVLCLALAAVTFIALVLDMAVAGLPRLSLDFFTNFPSRRPAQAGILSAWVGSTLVMMVTAAAAIPVGIAGAVYLEEYAPKNWFTAVIEINITNLAGVPSIVYGLLALGLFVYALGFGQSILSAGLTLGLLILPVVIVATREAIRSIPAAIREAAYAVGATKWETTWDHVLPYAMPGIMTGVIIGMARAIGETAPIITIGALTFIAFLPPAPVTTEFPFLSLEWIMAPFTVMPIQMFNWTSRPEAAFHQNAAAAGLVLLFMTLSMNALAIYIRYQLRKRIKW